MPGRARPMPWGQTKGLLLWLLVLGVAVRMTVFIRRRSGEEFADVDSYATVQIVLVLLAAAYLAFSTDLRQMLKLVAKTSIGLLLLYYGFGTLSAAWSPLPVYSLYRAFEVIVQFLAVFVAMSYCRNFVTAERRMLWVSLIVILLNEIVNLRLGGLQFSLAAWRTNDTPPAAMILCYCVGELLADPARPRRPFLLTMALMCVVFLALGGSSASIVASIFGLAVAFLLARNRSVAIFLLMVAVVGIGVSTHWNLRLLLLPGKPADYEVMALTGRVRLWTAYLDQIACSPICGLGFAVLPRIADTTYTTNTHSFVLSVLGGTGMLGMLIILTWGARLTGETFQAIKLQQVGASGCAAGLTAGLVNSLSYAFLGEGWSTSTLVLICLMAFHALFVARLPASSVGAAAERGLGWGGSR